jgi:hypothetical protein
MFTKIKKVIEKITNVTPDKVFKELSKDENLKDNIIVYNTEDQLYKLGIDDTGKSLGQYTPYTKQVKAEKGQPNDRITLRDTGAFYESFRVLNTPDGLLITADSIKDDKDLREEFGKEIIGLTGSNLNKVIAEARLKSLLIIRKFLK